ncbi:MAG: hypothetical protein JO352_21160 [Chloroflexi bacterium]|nr:hypothetical protein [Chloroflexota bacterium]
MRTLLTLVFASVVLGVTTLTPNTQHARDLVVGIAQDVSAILSSFAGGLNDPNGPVSNKTALARDSAYLDSATRKANELADELSNIQHEATAHDGP